MKCIDLSNGLRVKLENDLLDFLCQWKTEESRRNWKRGASLSFTLKEMKDRGWNNLSDIYKFEDILYALGFKTVPALLKNGKEHKHYRTVTV